MGRLTQCEATDLQVESLQQDKRKLTAEVDRLSAEVVQLRHKLAERVDAHVRDAMALLKLGAVNAELRAVAADRERLLAEGVAIVEGLWAELARLQGRAELDPTDRAAILAHILGTAGRDEPARGEDKP